MGIVTRDLPKTISTDFKLILKGVFGAKCSRTDKENVFKGCLPQILLGPFLNTLSHLIFQSNSNFSRLNPFHATDLFLYILKLLQKQRFSFSRGYRKGPVAWNGLNFTAWKVTFSATKDPVEVNNVNCFSFFLFLSILSVATTRSDSNNYYAKFPIKLTFLSP